MEDLVKREANYTPLSPVIFLERAASVYASRTSVIYGQRSFTWAETHHRARRLAATLREMKVAKHDVVAVLAPNVPALYEMHFAVPMAGAVLNAVNARLTGETLATVLRHSGAKLLFVDYEYLAAAEAALGTLSRTAPMVVVIDDADKPVGVRPGLVCYEELVQRGDPGAHLPLLIDEWDPITLNYTSGTTGDPKGVVYSHRGAYLSALTLLLQWEVASEPVYLWALPMFHCNGWTFTWGMAARGGTNVCIRATAAADMYRAISDHGVTHMCGVPTLFNMLLTAPAAERRPLKQPVNMLTGGAPPPPKLMERMERLGFRIVHAYGMTEATGPALVCEWRAAWDLLPAERRAALKARQGVGVLTLAAAEVRDPETMERVAADGRTMGEIMLRGSGLMKGYFKDAAATEAAFSGGWMRTGDVAVMHPDGYVEIKDRSKDVIISGGENISSVDVEKTIYGHPAVAEASVVAMPSEKWGESPCAFVVLQEGMPEVTEEEIIGFCRAKMPHFMAPKRVVFVAGIPKTANNKVEKNQLRAAARALVQKPAAMGGHGRRHGHRSGHVYGNEEEAAVQARSRL